MPTPPSILSVGQAAQLLQVMPNTIRIAADELLVKPAMRINAVDYFAERDVERIQNHLRSQSAPNHPEAGRRAAGLH